MTQKKLFKNFWTNCQKHPPSVVMVYERTEGGDFYAYQSKQAAGGGAGPVPDSGDRPRRQRRRSAPVGSPAARTLPHISCTLRGRTASWISQAGRHTSTPGSVDKPAWPPSARSGRSCRKRPAPTPDSRGFLDRPAERRLGRGGRGGRPPPPKPSRQGGGRRPPPGPGGRKTHTPSGGGRTPPPNE